MLDIIKSNQEAAAKTRSQQYIKRTVEPPKSTQIVVITGPRRAGKSYYALHEYPRAIYLNFDDERVTKENISKLVDEIKEKQIILDEIQNVPKWELLVNRLQREGKELIITGSNAHLLSGELATHLTGRYLPVTLLTLSPKELGTTYETYIQTGGYPEVVVNKQDLTNYVSTLLEATVYKDIVKRKNIRYATSVEKLAKYLYQTTGREISSQNLATELSIETVHTIRKYLQSLSESFLFFFVEQYSAKTRKRLAARSKPYAVDISGILVFAPQTSQGALFENTIAIELYRRGKKITYWKSQNHEIDFCYDDIIVQACYTLKDASTKKREILGLVNAAQALSHKTLTIITTDPTSKETFNWFGKEYAINIKNINEFLQEKY